MRLVASVLMMLLVAACGRNEGEAPRSDPFTGEALGEDGEPRGEGGKPAGSSADGTGKAPAAPAPAPAPQDTPAKDIVVTAPPPPPAAEVSDCYKGDAFTCAVEAAVFAGTNAHRTGLAALAADPRLAFVARAWSATQADDGSLSHDGFPEARAAVFVAEFGAGAALPPLRAENVAYSSSSAGASAEEVAAQLVAMWWSSSGHRRNMLGAYARLGVGVVIRDGAVYATQIYAAD